MIKRAHIRHFLAVADSGSFKQAAARLHVTQPTVSTSIAELERLVGSPLFVRDRRHVRLTEPGGAFLPIARDLEAGFRRADQFAKSSQYAEQPWPDLKLGVIPTVSGPMLQSIASELARDYGVELVEGDDHELRGQLASGKIQLALTLLGQTESGPEIVPLLEEPYVMVMAGNHPLAETAEVAAEELASEIMIARRSCEALQRTSRFFTDAGVRPRFALRSENEDRCLRMVAAGLGITVAPRSLAPEGTATAEVRNFGLTRRLGFICAPFHPGNADEAKRLTTILETIVIGHHSRQEITN
ncbi:LysR family transcriptional regulator [Novosphingobium sp. PhB165]|uniref:LysR family transcriptional regulator n=1 Tax=Novosphingobium sp. PhB165 TaxID=2485105 RepID=UPI0010429D64|nr:LysR family transcriptional regulator [Novosphingobium sp. PhB165]TCM19778.1 LysR family transcriptional regulator [Novosphingobium sp. PhB165]